MELKQSDDQRRRKKNHGKTKIEAKELQKKYFGME